LDRPLDSYAVQVVVHVDGGARGNPGPAAAAAVVSAPDGGVLDEAAVTLGHATNNVAEYRALLLGLERAQALGATEVDVINDSELVAKQVNGEYNVKHAALVALHTQARASLEAFRRWSIRSVPRAENAAADALVNRALDGEEVAPAAHPPRPEATSPLRSETVTAGRTDEPLLSVVQKANELWLELILHELTAARDALADARPHAAAPRLRRVASVWRLLLSQLELLETIGPEGVRELGDRLVPLTGSQSRAIEWISGERDTWEGDGDPPAGASLYDAFAGGLDLPAPREARLAALTALYREHADPLRAAWHDVAELLLDHDERAARWRRHHALIAAHPDTAVGRRFFPDLWDVRLAR
jgi:ribonuclease HI